MGINSSATTNCRSIGARLGPMAAPGWGRLARRKAQRRHVHYRNI